MKRFAAVAFFFVLLGCASTPQKDDTEEQAKLRAQQRVAAARLSATMVYRGLIPFVEEDYFNNETLYAMLVIQQNIDNGLDKAEELVESGDPDALETTMSIVQKALSDLKTYLLSAQKRKGESEP